MAELVNDGGSLRFVLALAAREAAPAAPQGAGAPSARLLAGGGIEYLDERDREWWPILRLSAVFVSPAAVQQLVDELRSLLQGGAQGFAWRPDEEAAIALQAGTDQAGAVVEVGLDVSRFLADVAGAPLRAGSELALFRFRVTLEGLVRFAGALETELSELSR